MKPFAAMRLRRPWSPAQIFDGSTNGVWLDPSDLSTVFQDSAGTTPGAVDSPVGLIKDKSGNGIDASQPTSGLRPTLRMSGGKYWLETTGSQWMFLGSSYLQTNFVAAVISARARSNTVNVVLLGKPHAATHVSPFFRWVVYQASTALDVRVNGLEYLTAISSWPTGTDVTLSFSTPDGTFSVGASSNTFPSATLIYSSNLQARLFGNVAAGELFNGRLYGLVIGARTLTADEQTRLTTWMNTRS